MFIQQRCKPVYINLDTNNSYWCTEGELYFRMSSGWGLKGGPTLSFLEIGCEDRSWALSREQAERLAKSILKTLQPLPCVLPAHKLKPLKEGECDITTKES